MVMTAVLLVAIGVVITAVTISGIGNTFSLMIGAWSGGSVLIAIALIALASLVLGMGLPVTAAYIVIATLSAPALADLITRTELINAIAARHHPRCGRRDPDARLAELAQQIGQPMSPRPGGAGPRRRAARNVPHDGRADPQPRGHHRRICSPRI
jgi:hypothetical protein